MTPSRGALLAGSPSFAVASATAAGWANLRTTSNARNATGIPVSTRPGQRRVFEAVETGAGAIVSSVASMVVVSFDETTYEPLPGRQRCARKLSPPVQAAVFGDRRTGSRAWAKHRCPDGAPP